MNPSLKLLCAALKKIIITNKPRLRSLSFIILAGRHNQGKSTLMRQSNCDHHPIGAVGAEIYTNPYGIVIELGETWLNQEEQLLEHTVKQLNSIHRLLKITGIVLCVDINELLLANHADLKPLMQAHAALLERFGRSLGYPVDTAVMLSKLDLIPGFCEFFQADHPADLAKPLGFSIYDPRQSHASPAQFKLQFDQLVQQLGQQVTDKIHPVRSNIKRSLIREFPLQIASLRNVLLPLMGSISPQLFRLQALYFTCAEQGGIIQDKLNKKIQHEFALVVPDQFHQSTNYRAYFVEGALHAFQKLTQQPVSTMHPEQRRRIFALLSVSLLIIVGIAQHYRANHKILAEVTHELQVARALNNQQQADIATYHVSHAAANLALLSSNILKLPMVKSLKNNVEQLKIQQITQAFIPKMLKDLEQAMTEQSPLARYEALKIYLMLGDKQHFDQPAITTWFQNHWQGAADTQKLELLRQVLHAQNIAIKPAIVRDTRNYLNALPPGYLYYALAEQQLPTKTTPLKIAGFKLSNSNIPVYFTQSGFQDTMALLPRIVAQLSQEHWVLERQEKPALQTILAEAYCHAYVNWWQHFLAHTHPKTIENYEEGYQLTQILSQSGSFNALIQLIQAQTKPQTGAYAQLFNQEIANAFSDLNVFSQTRLHHLNTTLAELSRLHKTLALLSDQGKTAFYLVKARFEGDKLANPLSLLYQEAQEFPEPFAGWATQIANDTWYMLISNGRGYLNALWQELVFDEYRKHIAERYPLDSTESQEISLKDFNHFFATHGSLNRFLERYIKPFLDTSKAQWERKELNHYVLPISDDSINEFMRANVITHMFFPNQQDTSHIDFSLQKISLDPVVSALELRLGHNTLSDDQETQSVSAFQWPQSDAHLVLYSIEGKHFSLDEQGTWAFFKLLQKVNVLVDEQDSSNLEILFEINGNSGRYLLKADNQVNPFIPGILNAFTLVEKIV